MPRIARVVIGGLPHHVTQRGNDRQNVFFKDQDYLVYLKYLKEQSANYGLQVLGYCLMTNHVHLIVVPEKEESLAKGVGATHFRYTQYINQAQRKSGHLWQNRFYSCVLDDPHFWAALTYVERNPVRAKMANNAWEYRWSSTKVHCALHTPKDTRELIDIDHWRKISEGIDWRAMLVEPEDEALTEAVRRNTRTGRPLGSKRFIRKLETLLGIRLHPFPPGRPRKRKK